MTTSFSSDAAAPMANDAHRPSGRLGEPRVAAVCYSFPVTTQSFHHRRLRAMADLDSLQGIYYVRRRDGHIEDRSIGIVSHAEAIRAPWWRTVLHLARPRLLLLVLRCGALARPGNQEGGRVGALWQALQGVRLGLQLRSTDATVIHATFSTASATVAMLAATVARLPYTVEVHAPTSALTNPRYLAMKLRAASMVFAISRYAAQMVTALAPGVSAEIVHCGIDVDDRPPRADAGQRGSNRILSVGSLQPKKGHRTLIHASALLAEEVPHSVTIVGDGPDRADLEAEIRRLGAPVELLGELPPDSVADLRQSAAVGVLASVRDANGNEDGIPVALMEFMADGVPVVGTDVAGIAELLDEGEAGALVQPESPEVLADALRVALTDEAWWRDRAAAGRRVIEVEFSNRTETRRLVERLGSLTDRRRSIDGGHATEGAR